MTTYGLDLSAHNKQPDFNRLKEDGNSFVILHAGYGWGMDQKDPAFEAFYKAAKDAGLNVGAYHYSYARNEAEAKAEAECFLSWIKGKTFEMPVYVDMEDADSWKKNNGNPSGSDQAMAANVFMETVQKAGYFTGIYSSSWWFDHYLKGLDDSYCRWIASWGANDDEIHGTIGPMHQYTSEHNIDGKRYDRNVCYVNYPSLIRKAGLNGFGKEETMSLPKIDPDQWISSHKGKIYDIDGVYGIQCVDLFKIFLKEIGYPNPAGPIGGDGYADQIWYLRDKYKNYFTFETGELKKGDIVLWAKGSPDCPYSHVAMFVEDSPKAGNRGIFLGSNQGYEHSNGNFVDIDLSGALGALRYKGFGKADSQNPERGKLIAEHRIAKVKSGHNINLRLDSPTGRVVGQIKAGEKLEYDHKVVTNGHRYVVSGNLYMAVTPTESRADYWADILPV